MKGQTSLELALITVIVIIAALASFLVYSEEATHTVAEATMRSQVDLMLAQGKSFEPNCVGLQFVGTAVAGDRARTYTLDFNGPTTLSTANCVKRVFDPDDTGYIEEIQELIGVTLGCKSPNNGECKGYAYSVTSEMIQ